MIVYQISFILNIIIYLMRNLLIFIGVIFAVHIQAAEIR